MQFMLLLLSCYFRIQKNHPPKEEEEFRQTNDVLVVQLVGLVFKVGK